MKIARNNELKEIDTKNVTCYYFDAMISINCLHFDNILLEEKSSENICHAENI